MGASIDINSVVAWQQLNRTFCFLAVQAGRRLLQANLTELYPNFVATDGELPAVGADAPSGIADDEPAEGSTAPEGEAADRVWQ